MPGSSPREVSEKVRLLRARVILPMDRPPIEDGAVWLQGNRVVEVGSWRELRAQVSGFSMDLGEVVVLPGLINTHAHLDYTGMAGQLPSPRTFPDWIQGMLALKAAQSHADYAAAWIAGAMMLLRHGTTMVIDIEAVPELLPGVWGTTPLRVGSCLELTGVRSGRDPQALLQEAVERLDRLPGGRCWGGLSPHAPYSTPPALLRGAAGIARQRGWLLTTHVAESAAEFEMFREARGPMHDWLRGNGRDMTDCGERSPVQHLAALGVLSASLLAVHANYLADGDAQLLAEHRVGVVHCPRSHAYFGHAPFPYETLMAHGVNVTLGTDSLASVRWSPQEPAELDLFAELRAFASAHPEVAPRALLAMVTRNAATALGMSERFGRLGPGSRADLIALPASAPIETVEDAVLAHRGNVYRSMIDGQWAYVNDGGKP